MPKIKKAIDLGGGVFYPITITDGVYDIANSQRLSTTLAGKADKSTTYTKTEVDNIVGDCAYIGDDDGSAVISDPPITPQSIGFGIGTCSTDATTAAKEVNIQNFVLTKNGIISIRFQKGIKVASPTLNVNSTGAKSIMLNGINLPVGVVAVNTTVMLQYDGTNWNVVGSPIGMVSEDELLVDLGLPSGVKWATRNIDVTQPNGFAASPYQYECSFFSWGNTDGHNPTATNSFGEYSWGSSNSTEPYVSSAGATLTGDIGLGYDAANANIGGTWRMPTTTEFAELFNNIDYINPDGTVIDSSTTNKLVTVNGIVGLYLKSKLNNNTIFFSCSGFGNGQTWYDRGAHGYFWSSSLYSSTSGRYLYFSSGGVNPQHHRNRFYGFAVRPVQ